MIEDQQTHTLPKTPDGLDHVARFMGYADTAAFEDDLLRTPEEGAIAICAVCSSAKRRLAPIAGSLVFTGVENDPETLATLARMGFASAGDVANVIRGWHHGRIRATRSARARELLTTLMPALLDALAKTPIRAPPSCSSTVSCPGLPAGVRPVLAIRS